MKRTNKLFEILVSDENLMRAINEVNKSHHYGKNHKINKTTLWVELNKEYCVKDLRRIILSRFEPSDPQVTIRYDYNARKDRIIKEPKLYPDQYIHHALVQVLEPIMMRGMDEYCCGSIRGRGTSKAKQAIEKWVRHDIKGTKYELVADIRHFYDNIQPKYILDRMRHLIKDHRVMDLIRRIIEKGICIGYYTSQWLANTLLQPLDQMIRQSGLCTHYVRYIDNLTIFGSNKRKLRKLKLLIDEWLERHGLMLKDDWQIFPINKKGRYNEMIRLPDAVGYRYGRDFTIHRKKLIFRLKKFINRYIRKLKQRQKIPLHMAMSILSRLGMIKHCNNYSLYKMLFHNIRKFQKKLKDVIRSRKRVLEWNMYLEQVKTRKFSRQKATLTAI